LPGDEGRVFDPWMNLEIVTLEDQAAWFVDGKLIYVLEETSTLGGTLALGVDEGSIVHFDTLIIRDTTPHDQ
jgi:hypothetical protein